MAVTEGNSRTNPDAIMAIRTVGGVDAEVAAEIYEAARPYYERPYQLAVIDLQKELDRLRKENAELKAGS